MGIRNAYIIKAVVTDEQLKQIENKRKQPKQKSTDYILDGVRAAAYYKELNKTEPYVVTSLRNGLSLVTIIGSIGAGVNWDDVYGEVAGCCEAFAFTITEEETENIHGMVSANYISLTEDRELYIPGLHTVHLLAVGSDDLGSVVVVPGVNDRHSKPKYLDKSIHLESLVNTEGKIIYGYTTIQPTLDFMRISIHDELTNSTRGDTVYSMCFSMHILTKHLDCLDKLTKIDLDVALETLNEKSEFNPLESVIADWEMRNQTDQEDDYAKNYPVSEVMLEILNRIQVQAELICNTDYSRRCWYLNECFHTKGVIKVFLELKG